MSSAKKKLQISKKTILIASILTVLIGVPIAIYLITQNASRPQASWYNSSWNYRRSITVGNTSGATLTNEDVLIVVDTAALVTASKLQTDCGDLRFVDSDDSTVLTYWIEGGCNTSTTQIWVRVPSLPNGGKTIYMYYDNSGASNGEDSWSGNFITLSDATCSGDWVRDSTFDSRYPRGSTTYGGTGGASSHTHTVSASCSTASAGGGYEDGGTSVTQYNHSHSVSKSCSTNTSLAPYRNMIFCENDKLDITTNSITIFETSTVTGWTRFSALDSRFPRGDTTYSGTGGSSTHSHTISLSLSSAGSGSGMGSGGYSLAAANHTHSVSNPSTSGTNIPPYLNVVYMEKDSAGTLSTERPIYMLDTATMPLGWTRFSALDNNFPQGATTYGGTGGSSTHSHSGSQGTGGVSSTVWIVGGGSRALVGSHTHSISWSTGSSSHLPPYVNVIFAKRNSSQSTTVSSTEELESQAPTAPTSLLTEGQTNPTDITDTTPEFSAIYNDPDTGDTSSYYEIEVNTASDFSGTSMWDTGKTSMTSTDEGSRCPDSSYAGTLLSTAVTYYWRIKFWDEGNSDSPWSSTANFQLYQAPSWYNTNWDYRRSVTVSNNTGSTLTNEDVLVVVNTSSLITAGTLQTDCDDLRFVDSDDSTALSYWVEGGCNTTTTQVWVRIPSLQNGGKTIYMYYGNSSATNAEESWSGTFTMFADTSCPTGWTRKTDLDNRFPYGATTSGTTGGSSSHGHGTFSKTSGGALQSRGCSDGGCGSTSLNPLSHTHLLSATVDTNSSVLPPYKDTIFCSKSDLDVNSGLISIFQTTTPSGWTYTSIFEGYMPRGASSYGSTGGSTTHTHTLSSFSSGASSAAATYPYANCGSPPRDASRYSHTHTLLSGNTSAANNVPPYLDVRFSKADNNTTGIENMILMTSADPPLGWSNYTSLNSRFPRGSSTAGGTGGSASHTHTVTINAASEDFGDNNPETGSSNVANEVHGHTASGTSTSVSNIPPYITVIYSQRNSSQSTSVGSEDDQNTAPTAPTNLLTEGLTNPIGITDLTPEFKAQYNDDNSGDTSSYYEIEVNTSSDFTGTSMWDTSKTSMSSVTEGTSTADISYNGTTLSLNGTTYYWRIRFWDQGDEEGTWATVANFTMNTPPNQPSSLLTEGSTNPNKVTDTTPEFSAIFSDPDSTNTGEYYEVEVNTSSDFTGTVMWDSTKTSMASLTNSTRCTDIPYNGTALSSNGLTYYWRIKFWDNNDTESNWSSTANFIMTGNPNDPTNLLIDNQTNPIWITSKTPTFSAIYSDPNDDDSSYYQIEVNTLSNFTGTVMWDTTKTAATITSGSRSPDYTYSGTTLTHTGTVYYIRMRFWDSDDNASGYVTGQFTDTLSHFTLDGITLEGLVLN